jgi:lia operon protein LiaG
MNSRSKIAAIVIVLLVLLAAVASIAYYIILGESSLKGADEIVNMKDKIERSVNEEKTEKLDGVGTIQIKTVSEDINIINTDGDEVTAKFTGSYVSFLDAAERKLKVTKKNNSMEIAIDYGNDTNISTFSSTLKLDVYVPSRFNGSMIINTASGDTNIEEYTLKDFSYNATSGGLTIPKLTSDNAKMNTTSGDMQINGSFGRFIFNATSGRFFSEELNAENAEIVTMSGDIQCNGSIGNVKLSSTSGMLRSDSLKAKDIELRTTSGDAELTGDLGNITASSTSGQIKLTYDSFDYQASISTTSGDVSLMLPETAVFAYSFKTSSGDADCAFPNAIKTNHSASKKAGEGLIKVSTISGGLNIDKN